MFKVGKLDDPQSGQSWSSAGAQLPAMGVGGTNLYEKRVRRQGTVSGNSVRPVTKHEGHIDPREEAESRMRGLSNGAAGRDTNRQQACSGCGVSETKPENILPVDT